MRTRLRIVATMAALSMVVLPAATVLGFVGAPVAAATPTDLPIGVRPVPGPVVTRFDPPSVTWGSGHRGVDLEGTPGEPVVAAADGTVTFAAVLVGRGVVVVDHGDVRTTYEPVAATVTPGDVVARGQPIGRLQAGHASCPSTTCLHWGLRDGDTYLDPLLLLGAAIRLLPASATPGLRTPLPPRALTAEMGGFVRPAPGPVTSPYGMRRHPITGVWKLHDGTDLGAPCGSPIRAAAGGRVVSVTSGGDWGNRLVVDSGSGASGHVLTAYNHAQRYNVAVGDRVATGQEIGVVGSTGLVTGCHLHVQVWVDGRLVDPMTVLP